MRITGLLICLLLSTAANAQLTDFDPQAQPAAPDYADEKYWSALPFREDAADMIPDTETWVNDSLKDVDVFYIYPTIYLKGTTWNANVNNKALNKRIDRKPVRFQASVFNQTCRVYAPRYRQAVLDAFYTKKEEGQKALEFAYEDVKRAFQYYLDHYNHGRPVIIASHSQGTWHARKLLAEFFDNKGLKKQLVAAYIVGFSISREMYTQLKPCANENETGCYVTWASFKMGHEPYKSELYGNVCVNPVTWNMDTAIVDASKSMGCILLDVNKKYAGDCATQIHNNVLWVDISIPIISSWTNLHIADYNLFWYDIRANVKKRVEVFMNKK